MDAAAAVADGCAATSKYLLECLESAAWRNTAGRAFGRSLRAPVRYTPGVTRSSE